MTKKYLDIKNNDFESLFLKQLKFILLITVLFSVNSCNDEKCDYSDCSKNPVLNLSSGIDANGDIIPPAFGAVDPFWRVLNMPPFENTCTNPAIGTFNSNAFAMNFSNLGINAWVNQPGSTTIAPFDLGANGTFGCNNALNSDGNKRVPYVFDRSFCVLSDTNIDFSFSFRGDDEVFLELVNNSNNLVLSTSAIFTYPGAPLIWTVTNLPLLAGSYSIRASLANIGSTVLGFSFVGNMVTTNGDQAISNNSRDCCENNVISVLNILEQDCNRLFNSSTDALGNGWTFNLLNASNTIIKTQTTDINGNIFFAGLADGTYTVQIVNQTGWTQNSTSQIITVANNQVIIAEFFSCRI